ncbi:MAG: hypothetical protein IJ060_09590 [Oscillospiraceae bacterium]|nr:hypothetical protein [Oscillospiraceae bacterium]
MKHLHPFFRLTAGLFAALIPMTAIPALPVSAASSTTLDAAANAIRTAWTNYETVLNVSSYSLTLDEITDLYMDLLYTDSDWFYIKSFYYQLNSRNRVTNIQITYNYEKDEIDRKRDALNQRIDEITSGIQPEWSTAETVLYLHDSVVDGCEYDFTYTYGDAYAALVGGEAVCQGYALAMNLLCREVGIPCYAITSDSLNHMWNVVNVDGSWYQLDATNDDFAPNMLGHTMHAYVLCSDAYMQADINHNADDWNYFSEGNTITCSSTAYEDAFWVGACDTVEPMPDGTFIYAMMNDPEKIQTSSQIYTVLTRGSLNTDPVKIGTVKTSWPTPDNKIYTACYVCSDVYGDMIYYHTVDSIYKITLSGSSAEQIYTLTAEEKASGYLYGIRIDDETGILTYQIMERADFEDPNSPLDPAVVREFHTLQLDSPEQMETTTATSATTTTATTTTTTTTTTVTESTTTTTTTTTTDTDPTTTTTTTTAAETTTTVTEPAATTTTEITTTTTATEITTTTTTTATETTLTPTTTTTTETTTTATTTAEPIVMLLRGDTDCNGEVNVLDAVMLARITSEDTGTGVTAQGKANSDCDLSGSVDAADLTWLLKFLSNTIGA